MSFNGSGTFLINSVGNPTVTGTTISSTWANALTADLATGLTNAICKDGQSTTTGTIPFATAVTMALTLAVTGKTRVIGGVRSESTSSVVANGAAATMFTPGAAGIYAVLAFVYDGVATATQALAIVACNRTNSRIMLQTDGSAITITQVTNDIRVNNNSGGQLTINYTYLFIPDA